VTKESCSWSETIWRFFIIQKEVAFENLASLDDPETSIFGYFLNDFQGKINLLFDPAAQITGMATVSEGPFKRLIETSPTVKKPRSAIPVLDASVDNLDSQQALVGVGCDVALASVDLFTRVEAFESPF